MDFERQIVTSCCDTWGNCTQGRDCPARTGIVLPHQAAHAARVASSHPHQPKHTAHEQTMSGAAYQSQSGGIGAGHTCDGRGLCIGKWGCGGKGACHSAPGHTSLPIQFVGPEPIEPTGPVHDEGMPLSPKECRQIASGVAGFCAVFVGVVAFGSGYGWVRFGADLVTYFAGGAT